VIPGGSTGPGLPPPPSPDWELPGVPDVITTKVLADGLSLPEPLCRVLVARGISTPEAARRFLRPRLDHLNAPNLLTDAGRAVDRILSALERDEIIFIHGDYDVDGVCSAALLTLWLRRLGGRVVPFVPHRLRDGYDLGPGGIEAAREAGAALVVTCDSGIRAHQSVARLRELGIDVIVTDHHAPGDTLPPAVAVVNPSRSDCDYPDPTLAGVGVAFKLCQLLGERRGLPLEELLPHLDLVALATVADLVPLRGENRTLVRFGLRALAVTARPGLRALMKVTGVDPEAIDAGRIGFVLAPRLNAAGRMGAASDALNLLLTDDEDEALALAKALDAENTRRRDEDRRTFEEIEARLATEYDPSRDFGVVIEGEGWHPGVIGIVASRVVERIFRPAVVIASSDGRGRGSARSVPQVDLFRAVEGCARHLARFGGHRQAAGMDLELARLEDFREAFNALVREQLGGRPPRPVVRGDAPIRIDEVSEELHHLLQYMGPFGIGNPRPVFWARGERLVDSPRIVGGRHLKVRLGRGRGSLDGIGFGLGDRLRPDELGGGPVDLLFQLRDNEYRGVRSLQARLVDLRPSPPAPPA